MTLKFLKTFLLLDAASTAILAVVLLFGGAALANFLGLPASYLVWGGLICIVAVAVLVYAATRPAPPASAVWEVVAINLGWVIASLVIFVAEHDRLTAIGGAAILGLAAIVFAAALIQIAGARMLSRQSAVAA